jgi:cbb3-type cytochrome oxidase maturation protein
MEVLILTVFVSLVLVAGELVFFAWNIRHGTHDHTDRLTLLPLDDEQTTTQAARGSHAKKGD